MAREMRGSYGFVMGGKLYSFSTPAGDDGTVMNVPPGALSVEGLLLQHGYNDSKEMFHASEPEVFDFEAIRDKKGNLSIMKLRTLVTKEIGEVEDEDDREELVDEYESAMSSVENTLKAHGASDLIIEVIKAINVGANLKPYGKEPKAVPLTVKLNAADICTKQEAIEAFTAMRDAANSKDKKVVFEGKPAHDILSDMVSGKTPINPLRAFVVIAQAFLEPGFGRDKRLQAQLERIIADTYFAGNIVPAYSLTGHIDHHALGATQVGRDASVRNTAIEFLEKIEWPILPKDLPERLREAAAVEEVIDVVETFKHDVFDLQGARVEASLIFDRLQGVSFLDPEDVKEMEKAVDCAGQQLGCNIEYRLRKALHDHAFKTR